MRFFWSTLIVWVLCAYATLSGQSGPDNTVNEQVNLDKGWKFALGNPQDRSKDYKFDTSYFSDRAKTGYGDGPAATGFDDRAWQDVDLPHDWAVGLDFSDQGSHSHGFKALGKNFPQNNIGWYRRSLSVDKSDSGKRINLEFQGIYRDAQVWVNGHFIGSQESGYLGFESNISEFLNYGGNNVIAVRVDASREEGWFYEGAGIYRHVWLSKSAPLHVQAGSVFVRSAPVGIKAPAKSGGFWTADSAQVSVQGRVELEDSQAASYDLAFRILDQSGLAVAGASANLSGQSIVPFGDGSFALQLDLKKPQLWDLDRPVLYQLETTVRQGGKAVDRTFTSFGIRSSVFDPEKGYFLNGRRVELKGVNLHQDHAGVGVAIPDALQEFRIRRLQDFGCNAIRMSHNPPAPALLDACDRLGMVVMPENRLMGTGTQQMTDLERLILRDRNHPSVIIWSLGNEEWGIEGNTKGTRIARTMQDFAHSLDPSRPCTVGVSGGWGGGISQVLDVMGFNYIVHGSIDRQHAQFPGQSGLGTEETTTQQTRGIWFNGTDGWLAPRDKGDSGGNIEFGWKYYAQRPFLAGLFYWTGFDYRGEPTPFGWPAISSQFGILDTCGFGKDSYWYLKSWWTDTPVLHINQHWNWAGREGQEIPVTVNANCPEVELFLNGKSLGRQTMETNGHLAWNVPYEPGTLEARGYKDGKVVLVHKVETAGEPALVQLASDRQEIRGDAQDMAVVTVSLLDAQGRFAPLADQNVEFSLEGPGRIIGVGNGNPISHEADVIPDQVTQRTVDLKSWRFQLYDDLDAAQADAQDAGLNTAKWKGFKAFSDQGNLSGNQVGVYRAAVKLSAEDLALDWHRIGFGTIDDQGWVYVNGILAGESKDWSVSPSFDVKSLLKAGDNVITLVVYNSGGGGGFTKGAWLAMPPLVKKAQWQRKAFNGLCQVMVQSRGGTGDLVLKARGQGLKEESITLKVR